VEASYELYMSFKEVWCIIFSTTLPASLNLRTYRPYYADAREFVRHCTMSEEPGSNKDSVHVAGQVQVAAQSHRVVLCSLYDIPCCVSSRAEKLKFQLAIF
jgi:hypothetical protein